MHRIGLRRLRRLGVAASLAVVAALAVVSATAASVDVGDGGSAAVFRASGEGKVFVCKYVGTPGVDERLQTGDNPISVSVNAIPDGATVGSYFEDSHGRSYVVALDVGQPEPDVSACPQPQEPPADVCPNIQGNQAEVPAGMVKDEQGNCVQPPPPVDECPNLEGNQQTVPDGYELVDGQCVVVPPPPTDVCPNLDGVQETVPYGYKLVYGKCVKKHHKKDVCPNLEGKQTEVPDGYEIVDGQCVVIPPPPTDVCPNIEGDQAEIPAGMVKDEQGKCVNPTTPPTTPPPPTVKSDEHMDVQVVKDATAQVQLVDGQAQIAYTIRVRNEGPNGAHEVELVDAAASGVTFLAVTQQPAAGSCTLTAALLHCSLGSLGPGVERTIGLSARVTQTGTFVNSATAAGNGKDTNGANNTDDAATLVTAPATPPAAPPAAPKPAAKPKPKPHVDICRVLKVTPGMVKANGNRQLVVAKVTQSRNPVKGVAVRFSGKGLSKVVKTNAQGVVRLSIAPRKAGIMLVKITSAKACNTARIGVIGAFEPPVTG